MFHFCRHFSAPWNNSPTRHSSLLHPAAAQTADDLSRRITMPSPVGLDLELRSRVCCTRFGHFLRGGVVVVRGFYEDSLCPSSFRLIWSRYYHTAGPRVPSQSTQSRSAEANEETPLAYRTWFTDILGIFTSVIASTVQPGGPPLFLDSTAKRLQHMSEHDLSREDDREEQVACRRGTFTLA